jgi:hypothetical protein
VIRILLSNVCCVDHLIDVDQGSRFRLDRRRARAQANRCGAVPPGAGEANQGVYGRSVVANPPDDKSVKKDIIHASIA